MSEERSCEEASQASYHAWIDDVGYPDDSRDTYRVGFAAGAAWARTPTLPAGMTAEKLMRIERLLIPLRTFSTADQEIVSMLDELRSDLLSWARDVAAGDRPPAEREES